MIYFLAACTETLAPGSSSAFYASVSVLLVIFPLLVHLTKFHSQAHFLSHSPCRRLNLTACTWGKGKILQSCLALRLTVHKPDKECKQRRKDGAESSPGEDSPASAGLSQAWFGLVSLLTNWQSMTEGKRCCCSESDEAHASDLVCGFK